MLAHMGHKGLVFSNVNCSGSFCFMSWCLKFLCCWRLMCVFIFLVKVTEWPPIEKIAAHSAYEMFSWYQYLIVGLVFSHLVFGVGVGIFIIKIFFYFFTFFDFVNTLPNNVLSG